MWETLRKVLSTIAIVAITTALLVVGGPVLGQRGDASGVEPAALGDPWVKHGWKNGPVAIPTSLGQVAAMSLPAGKYVVFAKLYFHNNSGGTLLTDCQLKIGTSWDWVYEETPNVNHEAIALNAAGTLAAPGKVKLLCEAGGPNVDADWIKITAIRAGSLRIVQL